MDTTKKNKPGYYDYDHIVSISFGSIKIEYEIYNLGKEAWQYQRSEVAACLFKYSLLESYDDYECISFGWDAKDKARDEGVFYIDKLSNKVEYLFAIEPNIKKPLKQAKDRLYQRAVVQYFINLIEIMVYMYQIGPSKNRYLITYPSHWTLEQAAYLRSLLQKACIVDEHDHPDRLIMYNEGEVMIRHIQSSLSNFRSIREGQKYMICDLRGSKVEMHLYDIKGPINTQSIIKSASRCNWFNGSIKEPVQMYLREGNFYPETKIYLSSLLSTPLINITAEDLEDALNDGESLFKDEDVSSNDESIFAYRRRLEDIEFLRMVDVENIEFFIFDIPQPLYDLYYEKLNNMKQSTPEPLPQWIEDRYIKISLIEIMEKVLTPVSNRITQYIKKTIETITDTIDDVVFVESNNDTYLMILIIDEYKEISKQNISKINTADITRGAVLKCLDNLTTFDIYKPKIVQDDLDLSTKNGLNNTQGVIVLIDYGWEKTRVSYIHTQPGQIAGDANIKHIMSWPGHSTLNRDFPTLNTLLFSKYPLNIREDSKINLRRKRDLFGNFSLRNSKAMFISQEEDGYNQEISNHSNAKFYTFEKDEYGIILVTHRRTRIRKIIERLLIVTTSTNSTPYTYKVTRRRISFQEFTLLYFKYLADFLHSYIYSMTSIENDKYRYCITHNNHGYPEKFTLSDKDIRQFALESKLIAADTPGSLLVLERTEAAAIYCRKLVDTTMVNNGEAHLYFLQVQLHPDRCLLILNTVPLLDREDSNSYREDGKPWECVHKYAETENISINFMDILSENLWIHMQRIEALLLRKCEQHLKQKKFFNSKNMQKMKGFLYDYISTTKDLNLENGEKEHTIRMCDKDPGSCCYLFTTNMDLLERAFVPAIDQLVSVIQSSISNESLFQGIKVSDIFAMGEFVNCQDYVSYKFLEELLLAKLKHVHFPHFNNIILQTMTKKTQVRKLNGREYQQGQANVIEDRHDSLAQISSSGSIMFSIDPRNLLVERVAAKTYIIKSYLNSGKNLVYNHPGRTLYDGSSFHMIISKGTPLNSLSMIEGTFSEDFMKTEYGKKNFHLSINLLVTEDSNVSYLTDTNMHENRWKNKVRNSNFETLKCFSISRYEFGFPPYPFSFKFCISRTEKHKFWIELGKNSKTEIGYTREPILLKSCHNE